MKTGKCTSKLYKCSECGYEVKTTTNHYGEYYDRCDNCSWTPNQIKTFVCQETLPKGWELPEPWKFTTLGDVATIVTTPGNSPEEDNTTQENENEDY